MHKMDNFFRLKSTSTLLHFYKLEIVVNSVRLRMETFSVSLISFHKCEKKPKFIFQCSSMTILYSFEIKFNVEGDYFTLRSERRNRFTTNFLKLTLCLGLLYYHTRKKHSIKVCSTIICKCPAI